MHCRVRVVSSFLACVGALVPAVASARELDYRATAGCPSRADVAARIDAAAPDGPTTKIEIRPSKSGYRGDLVVRDGDRRLARSIEARTCGAVVEALALVVALDREEPEPATAEEHEESQTPTATTEPSAASGVAPQPEDSTPQSAPPSAQRSAIGFGTAFGTYGRSFPNGEPVQGHEAGLEVLWPRGAFGLAWLRPSARGLFMSWSGDVGS